MPKTTFDISDRIGVNDHVGTVKYKGPVENAKGEYYGVEWDLISRGKHNGTHLGKTYFTTRNDAPSGSFIRGKMCHPALTCLEAIKDKYGSVDDELAGVDESEAYLGNQLRGRDVSIELVGMRKINDLQSKFDTLRTVSIQDMCVYGEEDSEALGKFIPLVEELDLSGNLLSTWQAVAGVIRHLTKLRMLYLSRNRLVISPTEIEQIKPAFQSIKSLILNMMSLSWDEILTTSELWLQIRELHVCKNDITQIASAPNWQQLRVLNLTSNSLKSWSNVKSFAKLPLLEELLLAECEIEDILVEDRDFPSLNLLNLNNNNISDWVHVGRLNTISTLTTMTFLRNPVLEQFDVETNRQLLTAKILNLKRLNNSDIDSAERKGAEIDYTKRYGEKWMETGSSMEVIDQNRDFCLQHPTYLRIIKKWGAPEETEVKKSKPVSALKDSLIEVTFVDLVTESGKRVTKNVPDTMSVVKCRNLAIKLLGIRGIRCTISYRAHQNGEEYDLEYDLRAMTFYGVQHGDEILLRQVP